MADIQGSLKSLLARSLPPVVFQTLSSSRPARQGLQNGLAKLAKSVKSIQSQATSSNRSAGSPQSRFLSIDVEFSIFESESGKQEVFPAEVCVIDTRGEDEFYGHCAPSREVLSQLKWKGGVPLTILETAQTIQSASEAVACTIAGTTLIGHGLRQDLAALGLQHPTNRVRDLKEFRKFQRKGGQGHSLKHLTQTFLGRTIQAGRQRHSAREDAVAIMELYTQIILPSMDDQLSEQEIIDAYLAGLLKD